MREKVLLALPDQATCSALGAELRHHGFSTAICQDGAQTLQRWRDDCPAIVLLHVDLPGVDVYELCRAIRRESAVPIVMLSPWVDDDSAERGFDAGADDYVSAATGHRPLIARLVAILRRPPRATPDDPSLARELRTATLRLDLESHEVSRGPLTTRLSPAEFTLLHQLAVNEGQVVATTRLMPAASSRGGLSRDTVRSRVASIRRKLRMGSGGSDELCSIWGRGYLLRRPD
jgi:DNA-binding response OmpR family regulator